MDALCAYSFPAQFGPSPRHLKMLNVDESALTNPGEPRFGGLTRDHNDKFSKGYYCRIGYANILIDAEIIALFHAIHFCWEVGLIVT